MTTGIQTLGLHHVALNVTDVDGAVEFYTKHLGFSVRSDRPDFGVAGAWLDAGAHQVHLIEATVPNSCGQHFAIQVEDLDAAIADLRDAGVHASDAMGVGTGRQAFVSDPSGNVIELHQPAG